MKTDAPARILLLGGEPWAKPPLLWWNFVGRTREEIEQFTAEWNGLTGNFAGVQVTGYVGDRLTAPPVPLPFWRQSAAFVVGGVAESESPRYARVGAEPPAIMALFEMT